MIRLSNTTKKLQAVLGGAITTSQPQAVVSFYDENNSGEKTRGADQETNLNSTTDVDICNALGTGKESYTRNIDTLTIYNRDTVSATVTVKIDDGGTETILVRRAIPPSGTLTYDHESGWDVTGDPLSFGTGVLVNGKIVATVGSNALTLAVKTIDGSDPSNASPVYVRFPSATLTESGLTTVAITAALSVVVSSGSTLGHASAIAQHVFVYLINNAGAAEVAVSNLPPDYPGTFGKARLVSTTAEGGAGAADSATGVYSTTARSNVSWICVAKILTTQTTAGTWAAAITQIDQAPFVIPSNIFSAYRSSAQTFAHGVTAKVSYSTELYDPDGVYDATTNYRYQPNVAGYYEVQMKVLWGSLAVLAPSIGYIYKNGSEFNRVQYNSGGTISNHCVVMRVLMNGTSDYLEGYAYQATGGNSDLGAGGSYNTFDGGRCANQGAS